MELKTSDHVSQAVEVAAVLFRALLPLRLQATDPLLQRRERLVVAPPVRRDELVDLGVLALPVRRKERVQALVLALPERRKELGQELVDALVHALQVLREALVNALLVLRKALAQALPQFCPAALLAPLHRLHSLPHGGQLQSLCSGCMLLLLL